MTPRLEPDQRNVVRLLQHARELLSDEEHWSAGDYAYDQFGHTVAPNSTEACKWCGVGALMWADGTNDLTWSHDFEDAVREWACSVSPDAEAYDSCDWIELVAAVNDHKGYPAVIETLDQTIRRLAYDDSELRSNDG